MLYSRTCNAETVNAARRILFAQENRTIENIPPTKAALYQHILRSVIQASKWYTCLEKSHEYKDPCEWGWKLNGGTVYPLRTELPAASQACRELVKCACKKSCTAHCIVIRQNFFVLNFALVLVSVLGKNDSNDTNLLLFDRLILLKRCLLFPHVNAKYDCVIWYSLVPCVKGRSVFGITRNA